MVLIFFTFCYIMIDEGMMMANAEVRYFLRGRKAQFEKAALRRVKNDVTLDTKRYTSYISKPYNTLTFC
jgi:hypothetical protein